MKLKFKVQPYQTTAVESVIDCFAGQVNSAGVTYRIDPGRKKISDSEYVDNLHELQGFKNADCQLSDAQLLANIQAVQRRQNLPLSKALDDFYVKDERKKCFAPAAATYKKDAKSICSLHLDIEMETGTGKTMVYLRTIMELHRRFGENKFIIVVPSRAIKAGVEDSLNKMRDYLSDIHNTDKYRSFVYDSKQVSQIQTFANSNFDIMLTTIQAFNSGNNVINQEYSEGFFGGKPLEIIQEANPIVIIDEPQSVAATDAGK